MCLPQDQVITILKGIWQWIEYEDIVYFSKVETKAATLKQFQLLLPEIKVFLEEKKQNIHF